MDKVKKFAVLIDADNSSVNSVEAILEEVAKYGIASVKRVYGDWSSETLKKWREILLPHAITPVQQFAYTTGKDATDMMLIIDAMDLLYTGTLDGFCIVSSDSDFTPLASRIRESGLLVYGFGRKQTTTPFVKACDKFVYVENLHTDSEKEVVEIVRVDNIPSPNLIKDKVNISSLNIDRATLNLVYKAVKDNADDNGWAYLGIIGGYINNVKPDFDTRTYGYDKLSAFIKALNLFETKMVGSQMFVRKSSFSTFIRLVQKSILSLKGENSWVRIDDIGAYILKNDPKFDVKVYGYDDVKTAINAIHDGWLEFSENGLVRISRLIS